MGSGLEEAVQKSLREKMVPVALTLLLAGLTACGEQPPAQNANQPNANKNGQPGKQQGKQPVQPGQPGQQSPQGQASSGKPAPDWQGDRYPDPQAPKQPPTVQSCSTQDAAIRLAMTQIIQKYGREVLNRQLPLEANVDEKGIWQVRGTLPPMTSGKVSQVRIDSRTGKVLSVK